MNTKNPTLKKIDGAFCYRLKVGDTRIPGDYYQPPSCLERSAETSPVTTLRDEEFGGVWRPVSVPEGLRIRALDEKAQPGDLSGVITNGVIKVDPTGVGPLLPGRTEDGMTVREIVHCPRLAFNEPGSDFQGDDFVVLAPVESIEARWVRLVREDLSRQLFDAHAKIADLQQELEDAAEENRKLVAAASGNAVLIRKDGFMRPATLVNEPQTVFNFSTHRGMESFERRDAKADAFGRTIYEEVQ